MYNLYFRTKFRKNKTYHVVLLLYYDDDGWSYHHTRTITISTTDLNFPPKLIFSSSSVGGSEKTEDILLILTYVVYNVHIYCTYTYIYTIHSQRRKGVVVFSKVKVSSYFVGLGMYWMRLAQLLCFWFSKMLFPIVFCFASQGLKIFLIFEFPATALSLCTYIQKQSLLSYWTRK